jgi:hypothetical protein
MISPLTPAYTTALPPAAASRLPEAAPEVAAYQAVDDMLDLSRESRNIIGALHELGPLAREHFLEMTASILKTGIVGYELFDTGNRDPEQSYLLARCADDPLRQTRPYREPAGQTRRLDLRG